MGWPRHRVEACPIRFSCDHRDFGTRGFENGRNHLGPMPDDALTLYRRSDHESRNVGQKKQGNVEGIAQPDETRRLVRRIDEENAALVHRLIGDHADHPPLQASTAAAYLSRIALLD